MQYHESHADRLRRKFGIVKVVGIEGITNIFQKLIVKEAGASGEEDWLRA